MKNCRYCNDKLPISKRVRSAEFCSPFHRMIFEAQIREARTLRSQAGSQTGGRSQPGGRSQTLGHAQTVGRSRTVDLVPEPLAEAAGTRKASATPPERSSSRADRFSGVSDYAQAPGVVHVRVVVKLPRWILWPFRVRLRVVAANHHVPGWLQARLGSASRQRSSEPVQAGGPRVVAEPLMRQTSQMGR